MADNSSIFCVKCDEKIADTNKEEGKVLKCNGRCNKGIHYTCSSYKQNELQFLESHKGNVKWFCDCCSQENMLKAQ